jgi:hypothetical protein
MQLNEPRSYIYLDTAGIDSLFSQTVDRLETSRKNSAENNNRAKVSAGASLGKALSMLFGAKLDAEAEFSRKNADEVTSSFTPEQKLTNLREYLASIDTDSRHDDIAVASRIARAAGTSVLVAFRDEFVLPQFELGGGGVSQVNEDLALELISKDRQIQMVASLSNFPRLEGGKMPRYSNDAYRLTDGRATLSVFGLVRSVGGSLLMKPYAIWE